MTSRLGERSPNDRSEKNIKNFMLFNIESCRSEARVLSIFKENRIKK